MLEDRVMYLFMFFTVLSISFEKQTLLRQRKSVPGNAEEHGRVVKAIPKQLPLSCGN